MVLQMVQSAHLLKLSIAMISMLYLVIYLEKIKVACLVSIYDFSKLFALYAKSMSVQHLDSECVKKPKRLQQMAKE